MPATIPMATSLAAWKQIAEERLVAVEMWKERSAKFENSMDLLCAAIADDSLGRIALQTLALNIKHPTRPTPEIIEWAQKVIRERAHTGEINGDQDHP